MDIRLRELLHNLKDHDFDVCGQYKVDENEANKVIKAIEGIETVNKWIPCSERLPEDSGDYIVWIKPDGEKPYVSVEDIDCDGMIKKWNTIYAHTNEIVAWMPLPQPYKAESEG